VECQEIRILKDLFRIGVISYDTAGSSVKWSVIASHQEFKCIPVSAKTRCKISLSDAERPSFLTTPVSIGCSIFSSDVALDEGGMPRVPVFPVMSKFG
jgi:hypothetical protein